MKLGFSLSSGGLLLPYHMGALQSLEYHGYLNPVDVRNPVAGSSAGAIATMAHGCGIQKELILEATIAVSDACHTLGGARGRLLPLLRHQMETLVGPEQWLYFQEQQEHDLSQIAYTQLFPTIQSHLQTQFQDKTDLFNAVSYSCHFPFFATNWPFYLELNGLTTTTPTTTTLAGVEEEELLLPSTTVATPSTMKTKKSSLQWPKVYVDGWFSVSPNRHGCVDIQNVDRTVAISPFPGELIGMDKAFEAHNLISPSIQPESCLPLEEYLRIATQATSRTELTKIYEQGFQNAEQWCMEETQRQFEKEKEQAMEQRKKDTTSTTTLYN